MLLGVKLWLCMYVVLEHTLFFESWWSGRPLPKDQCLCYAYECAVYNLDRLLSWFFGIFQAFLVFYSPWCLLKCSLKHFISVLNFGSEPK